MPSAFRQRNNAVSHLKKKKRKIEVERQRDIDREREKEMGRQEMREGNWRDEKGKYQISDKTCMAMNYARLIIKR